MCEIPNRHTVCWLLFFLREFGKANLIRQKPVHVTMLKFANVTVSKAIW